MIYFVTARVVERVKIGFSKEPSFRFIKMRTDSPVPLLLERVCEGDVADERALHDRFAEHRISGEWFRLCDEIEGHMATLDSPSVRQRAGIDGPLGHWLNRNGHTLATFAPIVGTTEATLSRICARKVMPRRELLVAIIEATDWEVDANSLLGLYPKRPLEKAA